MDKDWNWWPLLSLRPERNEDISNRVVLKMMAFFGPICGIVTVSFLHAVDTLQAAPQLSNKFLASAGFLASVLYFVFAKYIGVRAWNKRAARLREQPAEQVVGYRKKLPTWTIITILVLVLSVYGLWRCRLSMENRAQIAAIKKAGYPTTPREVQKWYDNLSVEKNIGFPLLKCARKLTPVDTNFPSAVITWITGAQASEPPPAIQSWHQANEFNIADLKQAAGGQGRYSINFIHGWQQHLADLKTLWNASLLLMIDSLERARQGDMDKAAESILLVLRLSNSIAEEPSFPAYGYAWQAREKSCACLRRILNQEAISAPLSERLEKELLQADQLCTTFRAWVGERAWSPLVRYNAYKFSPAGIDSISGQILSRLIAQQDLDLNILLKGIDARMDMTLHPGPEVFKRAIELDAREKKLMRRSFALASARTLMRAETEAFNDAHSRALVRTARLALAIERYRTTHNGAVPSDLSQLLGFYVAEIPKDPFDDKPLRYKRLAEGYIVYSIGGNLTDDGGNEYVPGKMIKTRGRGDITFVVEHPSNNKRVYLESARGVDSLAEQKRE